MKGSFISPILKPRSLSESDIQSLIIFYRLSVGTYIIISDLDVEDLKKVAGIVYGGDVAQNYQLLLPDSSFFIANATTEVPMPKSRAISATISGQREEKGIPYSRCLNPTYES